MEPLEPRVMFAHAALDHGTLRVDGSDQSDRIDIRLNGTNLLVTRGDETMTFAADDVARIEVDAGPGDDVVRASSVGDRNMKLVGGAGRDTLVAGGGDDTLVGNAGADLLRGGGGRDVIRGHGGHNVIHGGAGRDRLYGGNANDRISGGGADSVVGGRGQDHLAGDKGDDLIWGGAGVDHVLGGSDNDALFTEDNVPGHMTLPDQIDGGPGRDILRNYDFAERYGEMTSFYRTPGIELFDDDLPSGIPFKPNQFLPDGRSVGAGVIEVLTVEPNLKVRQWGLVMATPHGRLDSGFGDNGILAIGTTTDLTDEEGHRRSTVGTQEFFSFPGGRFLYTREVHFYHDAPDGTPILGYITYGARMINPDGSIDTSFVFDRTNRLARAEVPFFPQEAETHRGGALITFRPGGSLGVFSMKIEPDGTLSGPLPQV